MSEKGAGQKLLRCPQNRDVFRLAYMSPQSSCQPLKLIDWLLSFSGSATLSVTAQTDNSFGLYTQSTIIWADSRLSVSLVVFSQLYIPIQLIVNRLRIVCLLSFLFLYNEEAVCGRLLKVKDPGAIMLLSLQKMRRHWKKNQNFNTNFPFEMLLFTRNELLVGGKKNCSRVHEDSLKFLFTSKIEFLRWNESRLKRNVHAHTHMREHYVPKTAFFSPRDQREKYSNWASSTKIRVFFSGIFILCIPYSQTHSPANKLANKKISKQIKLIPSICCYSERRKKEKTYISMRKFPLYGNREAGGKESPFGVEIISPENVTI